MHCPKCGQEQISAEMRFCKSCGLSLDGVRELLEAGHISRFIDEHGNKTPQSPRRKGVRHGVILVFISMVFIPFIDLIGKPQGNFFPMIFLMAGLMRILYAVIFQEAASHKAGQKNFVPNSDSIEINKLDHAGTYAALPTSHGIPVSELGTGQITTTEFVSPPSVTEHTTTLLDRSMNPK